MTRRLLATVKNVNKKQPIRPLPQTDQSLRSGCPSVPPYSVHDIRQYKSQVEKRMALLLWSKTLAGLNYKVLDLLIQGSILDSDSSRRGSSGLGSQKKTGDLENPRG